MKRILSTALAIVLFVGASSAQITEKNTERHHGNQGEMMKDLNLSADQQARLKTIHEAERKEMQALKADGKSEAGKAARKEIHEKYRTQLESVLTPDQRSKFKEERKDSKGQGVGNGDRMGRGNQFPQELNLTADQKAKFSSLNQDFRTKMETVRNNSSLSASEKKRQIKNISEDHRTALKTILTPEQMEKMKTLHKGGRNKNL